MEGTVYAINPELGLAAIDTPTGFTIVEQPALDLQVGDFVSWTPEHPLGSGRLHNVSGRRISTVYFQNHRVSGAFLKVNLQL